jgi:hypothetical protein
LQEKSPDGETTDQEKGSGKSSNRKSEDRKYDDRPCLCDRKHPFSECYYLIEELRPAGWKPDEEMMKKIEKILETNSRIRTAVKWARKNAKRRLEKATEKEDDSDDEPAKKKSSNSGGVTLNASFAGAFAGGQAPYKLINCWTLDSGTDIHVCNDPGRFQLNRVAGPADQLVAGKTVYEIEGYETVNIVARGPDGPINIQLLNVALVPGFFTSLVCLTKVMKKGVH